MNKILVISLSLILVNTSLRAQETDALNLALKGIDLGTNLHYKESYEVFQKLIELEPENPRGYFLRSAIYFWMFSEDVKNEEVGDKFRDLSYEAVEVGEARLEKNENDIDAMFFLGGAYGSLGRYYALTKSYLNAYWYGKKGKNYLEDVIEMDSTYYDAYLGLGMYHYLADVLPRFVKILSVILGMEGNREQGIQEIKLSAEKGLYTKTEAMFFLGALYTYREDRYEEAIEIFNELLEKYPQNPGALLTLGRCYANMGQCDMAEASFNNILKNKESQSRLPRGSVFYQLGGVYFNMNDFFRAKNNYLLAIASDTAEVGKKRWTTPRAHYNVSICYEILGEIGSAKYHLTQIHEEDNARSYERAQERLNKMMKEIDISMIMAENLRECNNVDQALKSYKDISQKYAQDSDPYIQERLGEVEYRTAEIYFEQKNYNKAISLYEQVIQTRKEKDDRIVYRSYFNLGNCYKMIENYNSARQAYDAAEETDDDRLLARIENARKDLPEE
jgi:tetratricopeptide (TPR) repeat protein